MILIVGNEDGDIIGRVNITGTRWRLTEAWWVNLTEIIVPIHKAGVAVHIGAMSEDGDLYYCIGEYVTGKHSVGKGDSLYIRPGHLSWGPTKVGRVHRDRIENLPALLK